MNGPIRTVAVLTSGGDSPGFNPCIRAVVRAGLARGWQMLGVEHGFEGLADGDLQPMNSRSVSGIIGMGGTVLGSGRWEQFKEPFHQRRTLRSLGEHRVDALVVIGGNGTMRGTQALYEQGCRVIGVPGTIENDVYGTDAALGTDTALNTALDALDRIRDTASAQQQAFLVELMGEESGYLTLMAGLVGGAEMVCIPEVPFTLEEVACEAAEAYVRGKRHCIITVAEGAKPHAAEIADYLHANQQETGFGVRLSILGHIMRGGPPSAIDRYLGTLFGAEAIKLLAEGASGVMVGMQKNQIVHLPLKEVTANHAHIDARYLHLAKMLAR